MKRQNRGGHLDETAKPRLLHSRCRTIRIPPCSEAVGDKHRPCILYSPLPEIVTSPYELNKLERVKTQTNVLKYVKINGWLKTYLNI